MFIKHSLFTDVCIEVQSLQKRADEILIHGCFWKDNQPMQEPIKLTIYSEKIADWQQCVELSGALGDATWAPLSV